MTRGSKPADAAPGATVLAAVHALLDRADADLPLRRDLQPDERLYRRMAHRHGRGRNSSLFVAGNGEDAHEAFSALVSLDPGHDDGSWVQIAGKSNGQPAEIPGAQPVLLLRLGRSGGRVVVTGLHVETDGSRLAVRELARLPLAAIAAAFEENPDSLDDSPPLIAEPRRPGRRGRSPDFYERVAREYRRAQVRAPTKPVASMAHHSGRNPATIHRWLSRARELGYLKEEN